MKVFRDFASYNEAIGIAAPLNNDIDIGYYDAPKIIVVKEPVVIDFYRISIKISYRLKSSPLDAPKTAIFFNSPDVVMPPGWEAALFTPRTMNCGELILLPSHTPMFLPGWN